MEKSEKIQVIKKAVTSVQAKSIGDRLGIKKDGISPKEFTMGVNVEREHGSQVSPETNETKDDAIKTGQIAWAHLKEIKNYYTRLAKMEKEGKADYKTK